jgi:cellulose synthase/poly-beta-1,6-N-acetylglucosamine synthase-like glycosyltransferase
LGRLTRKQPNGPFYSESNASFTRESAPALTILVPSYKEEIPIIRQTLLSASLQEYPRKRVVLLLDDPPAPRTHSDRKALWAARTVPFDLQTMLAEPAKHIADSRSDFHDCRSVDVPTLQAECIRLSDCFGLIADWFETQAKQAPIESHTDVWFVQEVLTRSAEDYRQRAAYWSGRHKQVSPTGELVAEIEAAYEALAGRFRVEFDVFERKQYRNFSHEPNKAMNLNSYLSVMGKRVKPVLRQGGVHLVETDTLTGSRLVPDSPYVITLDADSLLMPQYATSLVRLMEQPGHERMAVAQTPYSAFPNAPGALERTAGATTDIQYFVHQGFTRFGATFWVGANALLRKSALEDICQVEQAGGITVRRYIQDRTVIEDTESTVDLLAKGWTLYNHAERLAYSATPPDFGSLVIQRARWANGGLIILPKLLEFLRRTWHQPGSAAQGLLQIHYLTSLALTPLSVLLLLAIPFSPELMTLAMPLAALPYFVLYARDLALTGYRPLRDLFRAYALNLLLIPVHLTGAVTSLRQMMIGTKIPFRRTPKISGRTRTSALDLSLQLAMVLLSAGLAVYHGTGGRWISCAFALGNVVLLYYGLKHFLGFAEMRQDLVSSGREIVGRCRTAWDLTLQLARNSPSMNGMYLYAQPVLRTRFFPRQVLWGFSAGFDMIATILA